MKREGRQHGMVRTCLLLPPPLNKMARPDIRHFGTLPPGVLFTKVSTKPNNHSKFTGKCAKPRCPVCNIHPVCKSKDKTKGNQKLKSSDVVANHRLVTWPGLKFSGSSASEILDHLSSDYYDNSHDGDGDGDDDELRVDFSDVDEKGSNGEEVMGFCNVDYVFDYQIEEDEGWCLVPQT